MRDGPESEVSVAGGGGDSLVSLRRHSQQHTRAFHLSILVLSSGLCTSVTQYPARPPSASQLKREHGRFRTLEALRPSSLTP